MIDIIQELLDDEYFLSRFCEGCPHAPRGTPDDFCPADGSPEETECLRRERFRRIEDAVEDVYRQIAEEVARDGARGLWRDRQRGIPQGARTELLGFEALGAIPAAL